MRLFRRKYFEGRCPNCDSVQKLQVENIDDELGVVKMACTECRHSNTYPAERVRRTGRLLTKEQFERFRKVMDDIIDYTPKETYFVGQKIRHPVFDEVGEVLDKEKTEADHKFIVVKFQKAGERKLVEGFKA